MKNGLFRKKSIDKISSPEQLDEYIRVSNPGVWVLFTAIIILLSGILVWAFWGDLDTTISAVVVSDNDTAICYIKEADIFEVDEGMPVKISGTEYYIEEILWEPIEINDSFKDYTKHVGNLKNGEWVYSAKISYLPAGKDEILPAEIVIDRIHPFYFISN